MVKKYNYIDLNKEKFEFSGKKIIIWGTSFSALQLYIELAECAIVVGFTDSFTKERGEFAGLPLMPYTEIEDDVWIYISTRVPQYQVEIMELLGGRSVIMCCAEDVFMEPMSLIQII